MRIRGVALAAVVACSAPAAVVAAAVPPGAGSVLVAQGVTAGVGGGRAVLSDGLVTRTWTIAGNEAYTASVVGAGRSWARPGADFSIDVDGVTTSPGSGWVLRAATVTRPPAQPGRPTSSAGAALQFRYALASTSVGAVAPELDRLVVLHPGAAVLETTTIMTNPGPVPLRVSAYTLDQVTPSDPALPAEVEAYNGGSDWRDDYRHVSHPPGAFDSEGEVVRLGDSAGLFLVAQRRGGAMSRVGRDAGGRCYVGVDWRRDLLDEGPLQSSPPSYNRLANPAYPVPVRARVLRPFGRLDLGTAYLGVYAGGAQEAAAAFTRDFVGADEPAFAHSVDLNTFHPWQHGPGMSDANLRRQVDAAQSLGVETFMLDDQWQGGPGGESGDWRFDPARFPDRNHDGRPDFVDYLHGRGLRLGLWMSPLEFNSASTTYAAHPDWACAPTGDATAQIPDDAGLGVWDVTNPAFQSYIVGVIDRLVRDYDVREFKFDFMAWVDCVSGTPPTLHDYADYEDAFVATVRRMQARHPDVTFELDETNDQRAWPFESAALGPSWFDNDHLHGSGAVAKLLHDVWSASPWLPTASLGLAIYDGTLTGRYGGVRGVDALAPLALLTHATFWTDLTRLTAEQRRETAWWLRWYRANRARLGPVAYELTAADPIDGRSWAAFQPWADGSGFVVAFRQSGGPATQRLALHGVTASRRYVVRDVRSGRRIGVWSGAQLARGLPVSLHPDAAVVLSVEPVR